MNRMECIMVAVPYFLIILPKIVNFVLVIVNVLIETCPKPIGYLNIEILAFQQHS